MDELIAKARRFVRERFPQLPDRLKSRGIKNVPVRVVMRAGNVRISSPVKRQLTREISEGRFTANGEAVKRGSGASCEERMILSRNRNYSRLATASPESDLLRIIRPAPEASTPEVRQCTKISTAYKNNLIIHLLVHPVPCF